MAKKMIDTPNLDQLEAGPWPSFVTGLKRLANDNDMMVDLMGQLETSYQTKKGYWKGGTVGVIGYGGGVIPRFTELMDDNHKPLFPAAAEFHTLRIMPPAGNHYTTDVMRKFCDVWEKYGSGLIAFHGQSGDIMFQGCTTANVQPAFDGLNEMGFDLGGAGPAVRTGMSCVGAARCEQSAFDELNEMGFDLGGAGPAVRTGMSCVGAARCEQSCFDEQRVHRTLVNAFLDDMHRPALPYKMKFKVSGCANDCMNSIHRSDFAVIGTWRDEMIVDQDEVKAFVADKGQKYVVDNVITRCPTNALSLNDDNTLDVDNKACVRCMHCLNVMNKALSPGNDKGVSVLIGGKRTLKIGDLMGTVIVPFMKMEDDDDFEAIEELAGEVIDFFAENALEHERTGEMIERIGLVNFLEGIGIEVDPNMINAPRSNSYVRMDGWDEEAAKWAERKA